MNLHRVELLPQRRIRSVTALHRPDGRHTDVNRLEITERERCAVLQRLPGSERQRVRRTPGRRERTQRERCHPVLRVAACHVTVHTRHRTSHQHHIRNKPAHIRLPGLPAALFRGHTVTNHQPCGFQHSDDRVRQRTPVHDKPPNFAVPAFTAASTRALLMGMFDDALTTAPSSVSTTRVRTVPVRAAAAPWRTLAALLAACLACCLARACASSRSSTRRCLTLSTPRT